MNFSGTAAAESKADRTRKGVWIARSSANGYHTPAAPVASRSRIEERMNDVSLPGRMLVPGTAAGLLLHADLGLSFWAGISAQTGVVTDTQHPLHGQCVTGTVLAIPSGRGSCTGSAVLLEPRSAG